MNNGMIGAIIGDIAGARFEWHNQKCILVGTLQNATRKLRVVRLGLRQMDGIGFRCTKTLRISPSHPLSDQKRANIS